MKNIYSPGKNISYISCGRMKFRVELTRVENGEYIACVPGFPGCVTQDTSFDEK
jgi:hypothetical protein